MSNKREELARDPDAQFGEPHVLLSRDDIPAEEKLSLLLNWKTTLIELQRATEENMGAGDSAAGESADKLEKVAQAIARVRKDTGQR